MRTIAYLSQTLVTDDTIAELVVEYARTLAVNDTSDTITIPTVADDGAVAPVELLLGPASQMMAGPSSSEYVDLDPAEAIALLTAKIERLRPGTVETSDSGWEQTGLDT